MKPNPIAATVIALLLCGIVNGATLAANEVTPSQGGAGQTIEDASGNPFMEEVIDMNKWNEEEAQRKKKSNLERPRLTEKQLMDNGLQMTPSGNLIPLINRGAPPIQQMGTRFTQTVEPIYPGYVVSPVPPAYNNPYMPGYSPFGISPFAMPFANPFMYGMNNYMGFGGYGMGGYGMGGYGLGFGRFGRFGGLGLGLGGLGYGLGGPGYGGFGFGGYPYGFGNPMFGFGMPYSQPTIISAPSYSYTYETVQNPDGTMSTTSSPSTFSSSGSVLSRPFWSGFAGNTFGGGYQSGLNLGLPMINQYQSSTTFTPIPPTTSTTR